MADEIEFWQVGEWTMVYLNGELVKSGDHYLADEWLQERVGVVVIDDETSASVPDGHNPVRTLAEARVNRDAHQERMRQAEEMRARAVALLAEADELIIKR